MTRHVGSDRQKYIQALTRQQLDREASPTPVPARITAALDLRELYGPEVDRACGVEEPAVDQWETGELVPTAEQIEALAKLTDFPVRFFYLPMKVMVGPIFMCGDDGCEITNVDEPAEETALVIPLTGRGRLL